MDKINSTNIDSFSSVTTKQGMTGGASIELDRADNSGVVKGTKSETAAQVMVKETNKDDDAKTNLEKESGSDLSVTFTPVMKSVEKESGDNGNTTKEIEHCTSRITEEVVENEKNYDNDKNKVDTENNTSMQGVANTHEENSGNHNAAKGKSSGREEILQNDIDKEDDQKNKDNDDYEKEDVDCESSYMDIYKELANLQKPGSTCVGGIANQMPSAPGLNIEGVGLIPLPLTKVFAEKIKNVAEQAPHGQGTKTVIDKSVRNTLQVDRTLYKVLNPAWETGLKSLVEQVAVGLGVESSLVRAEPYKLLLYEKGGFFKKHRDTEKADGMFATLVIQLPSVFSGSSFQVSNEGQLRTFKLDGEHSPYQCQYVAHYADCEHEIKPVQDGYRLALIYSLCWTDYSCRKPCLNDVGKPYNNMCKYLKNLPLEKRIFCLPLHHQYTTASLARFGVSSLKGEDRAKQQLLSDAGEGSWKVIIARIDKTDSEIDDTCCSYYGSSFRASETCEGSPEFSCEMYYEDGSNASIERTWIQQQVSMDCLDDGGNFFVAENDELEGAWGAGAEGEVEYTGNEGASRETTYEMYVMVVYSQDSIFERICKDSFQSAISQVVASPNLIARMLQHMKRHKPQISSKQCFQLLSLQNIDSLDAPKLEIVLGCHPTSTICTELLDSFKKIVQHHNGWNETTKPIQSLMIQIGHNVAKNCDVLLEKIHLFLIMTTIQETNFITPLIEKSIMMFNEETKKVVPSNYAYGSYYDFHDSRAADQAFPPISQKIIKLCEVHDWKNLEKACFACYGRLVKNRGENHMTLPERIEFVKHIKSNVLDADVDNFFKEISDKTVVAIKTISITTHHNFDCCVEILSRFGSEENFAELNQFFSLFKDEKVLKTVEKAFEKHMQQHSTLNTIRNRIKELLIKEYKELERDTKGGEPVFTWKKLNTRKPMAYRYKLKRMADIKKELISLGVSIHQTAEARSSAPVGITISNDTTQAPPKKRARKNKPIPSSAEIITID